MNAIGKAVLQKVATLLPNNDRSVRETWETLIAETLLTLDLAFREHMAHHAKADPDFVERLAEALDKREARALFLRLGTEAAQATTKERMRMLAYALAGLYTPDFEAEMRSRVSRAVLSLEPSDIVALRKVLDSEDERANATAIDGQLRTWPLPHEPEMEALIVTGCIQDDNKTRGGLYVTSLGRSVARALSLWR